MAEDQAPAPVEAPIKSGSKVTVELTYEGLMDDPMCAAITWPNGMTEPVFFDNIKDLPWLPPAPVLRVGGRARTIMGTEVQIKAIDGRWAFVRNARDTYGAAPLSDLTPLEDEG